MPALDFSKAIFSLYEDCQICSPPLTGVICDHKKTLLNDCLDANDPKVKAGVLSALAHYKLLTKKQLLQVLNRQFKQESSKQAFELPISNQKTYGGIPAIRDEQNRVVLRALELIVTYKFDEFFDDNSLIDTLNYMTGSEDDVIVVWVFNALYEVAVHANEQSCLMALKILTGHDNYLCRETAAAFLGIMANYGFVASLESLVHCCLTDKVQVKKRALLALAEFDPDSKVETTDFSGSLSEFFKLILDTGDLQLKQIAEDLITTD